MQGIAREHGALANSVRHAVHVSSEIIVPREIAHSTLRLAGSQIFVSATIPLNATVGAVAAKDLSGHESLAGLSVGLAFAFSMISLFVVGSIASHLGRKPVILAGLSLLCAGAFLCGLAIWAGSFALLVVGTAIFGCGQGPALLSRAAAADLYPPKLRGRGVGTVATAGAIGAVTGPLLAIAAESTAGAAGLERGAGPFLLVPVLGSLCIWLIVGLRPDPRAVASDLRRWYPALEPIPEPPPPRPRNQLIRLGPARAAIIATGLAQAAMVGVMSITSVSLGDDGWADWQVQVLMSAHFFGMFALAYPVGLLVDRIGRRRTTLFGVGVCALAAYGCAATGSSPLIAPFFFLLGLGWSACFVAGTTVMADVTSPQERGVLTATNDLLVAGCAAVASLAAGGILAGAGFWAVGVLFGSLMVFALPGLLRLQEPRIGEYEERPSSALAGTAA
jgi:MFS family permease